MPISKFKKETKLDISQNKLDFLLELEYLMRKIGDFHISLEEGYNEIVDLVTKNLKP